MIGPDLDMARFSWVVEGVLLLFVGCFGIVGNTISIIWFSRKIIFKSFHHLMLALAAFDLMYVCLSIIIFSMPSLMPSLWTNSTYLHMFPMLLPMAQVGLSGSIYFTVTIAVERYCAVCHPFWKMTHNWSSSCYILPISFLSFCYNIPKFFEHQVVKIFDTNISHDVNNVSNIINSSSEDTFHEDIVPTNLRTNEVYIKIYCIYLNLVVHGIIPLFLLIIIYISIYKQMQTGIVNNAEFRRHSQFDLHAREMKMAQVSCIIVAVFIVCHGVRWIPNVYELTRAEEKEGVLQNWPPWVQYITYFSHLLTVLNCSVNFYIYYFKQVNRTKRRRFSTPDIKMIQPSVKSQAQKQSVVFDTMETKAY